MWYRMKEKGFVNVPYIFHEANFAGIAYKEMENKWHSCFAAGFCFFL